MSEKLKEYIKDLQTSTKEKSVYYEMRLIPLAQFRSHVHLGTWLRFRNRFFCRHSFGSFGNPIPS